MKPRLGCPDQSHEAIRELHLDFLPSDLGSNPTESTVVIVPLSSPHFAVVVSLLLKNLQSAFYNILAQSIIGIVSRSNVIKIRYLARILEGTFPLYTPLSCHYYVLFVSH